MTRPRSVDEMCDAVRGGSHLAVRGGRTKSPSDIEDVLDVTGLTGVIEYSPEECVFTAYAGTRVDEIERVLSAHGQYLPFDPPFAAEGATLGGTVATGISGPRRYRFGGVRDFLLGVRLVDGEGRVIRSGGKVVKNAAGFLLHHALVGSCGRFGVLTELTFKVFPSPEARRTATFACESVENAFTTARAVEALRVDCEAIDYDEHGNLTVTIAGRATAMDERLDRLRSAVTIPFPGVHTSEAERHLPNWLTARAPEVSVVKVPAPMKAWSQLAPAVSHAQFMCAGAVAWLATRDLPALASALRDAHLAGQVIRGPHAGGRIGEIVHNEFEERVRRVMDPRNKFSAAPHTSH